MNYVSIVGTQVMAVLNPVLALLGQTRHPRPERISLLATGHTGKSAEAIAAFLKEGGWFAKGAIRIITVSDSLETDAHGQPPAPAIVSRLQEEGELCFDLAGGMNFQVAACIEELDLQRSFFVYPEDSCIQVYRVAGSEMQRTPLSLPPAIDLLKLMRVQGIRWEAAPGYKTPRLLDEALKRSRLSLPNHGVAGLRFAIEGEAGEKWGPTFDFIVNQGNRLRFLLVASKGGRNLEAAREVMVTAASREAFGQIFDREVAVLTDASTIAERLRLEEGKRVNVIEVTGKNDFFKIPLGRFLAATPLSASPSAPLGPVGSGKNVGSSIALYTTIAPNLMPTLKALWSHQPALAYLLYTPDDPTVLRLAEAISRHAKLLPAGRVEFVPVSFDGREILQLPAPAGSMKAEVNVTPGTKLQGALLMLWARANGGRAYSIRQPAHLQELPAGRSKAVRGPKPADYLLLSGQALKAGGTKVNARQNAPIYDFLAAAAVDKEKVKVFPQEVITLADGRRYQPEHTGLGTIRGPQGVPLGQVSFRKNGRMQGFWFEEVAAFALEKAGAAPVQLNLKTAWREETGRELENRYGKESFLSEIDVVAWYEGEYHVFSCKATEKDALARNAMEVKAQASLFGRMALSYVVFLRYLGEPYQVDGAWIFGLGTLTDPVKLAALMNGARAAKQTTGGGKTPPLAVSAA